MVKRTAIVHAWLFAVLCLAAAGCGVAPERVSTALVTSQSLEPSCLDPLCGGELVTFEQAQAQTPYHIPLPEGLTPQKVWIQKWLASSAENSVTISVAIQFENDITLIIHQEHQQSDWDTRRLAQCKHCEKISVNGIPGVGADPGVDIYEGVAYDRRGSVVWYLDGLDYSLYTDTVPLDELLKIAETLH